MHSQWQTTQSVLEKPKWYHFSKPFHFAIILSTLIVSVSATWYFWTPAVVKEEDIPIIRSQPGPIRIRPENSDAPDIPHQDKLIYDELTGKQDDLTEALPREEAEEPLDIVSPSYPNENKADAFPIANLNSPSGTPHPDLENKNSDQNFQVVVSQKPSEKEVKISLPGNEPQEPEANLTSIGETPQEISNEEPSPFVSSEADVLKDQQEQKSLNPQQHKLRSLPLTKLFALNSVVPKSMQKSPVKSMPIPKSQLKRYAHLTP